MFTESAEHYDLIYRSKDDRSFLDAIYLLANKTEATARSVGLPDTALIAQNRGGRVMTLRDSRR